MPNLDHDPQNPTDLLGRPLAAGDIVAWGTTYGRSAALCVAEIEKIRFYQEDSGYYGGRTTECEQHVADDYQLVLRPIKSTGSVSYYFDDGEPYYEHKHGPDPMAVGAKAKAKNVKLVKNVVKLEPMV